MARTPAAKPGKHRRGGKGEKPAAAEKPAAQRPSSLINTRVIYCGDCLDQLQQLPAGCIDLIYIDPPFNSNRDYEVFWGETQEKRRFEDRHKDADAYIAYMRPRCVELARVLKQTGSFYYHCDWHASHRVRMMLDEILGDEQFRSEIIWRRTNAKGLAFKGFPNNHDTIFYYGGGGEVTWNRQFIELDPEYVKTFYKHVDTATGRRYRLSDLTNPNRNRPNLTYEWNGHKRVWRWTKERMAEADRDGIIHYSSTGLASQKRFLDEMQGQPVDTIWDDIKPVQAQSDERLGYPTQKPLALLERIINASSNPDDIVLDAFCGCGTALVAAQNLGRQWVGIDISPTACRVMAKRLRDVCKLRQDDELWRRGRGFMVRNLPWSIDKLRAIPAFEFENWAVNQIGGIANRKKMRDMGIDGRIYPVGAKPAEAVTKGRKGSTDAMFADDWSPVQVKQVDKVGRPMIDQFEAVMERENRQRGYFVAFGYSSDAERECTAFHKRSGRIIKLLTVQEILDEEHVQKM